MTRNAASRLVLLVLIACFILTAIVLLFGTEQGHLLLSKRHLHETGQHVQRWVGRHEIIAPAVFIAAYVICALLMLPVWWLQVLAGYGFGLVLGTVWNCVAATSATAVTISLSHWLGGDWVHSRAGSKLKRLRELSVAFENNGFLVVLVTRMLHGIPFGLSNYLFGLLGIHPRQAAAATFVGALPVNAFYAALGSRPALVKSWKFWAVVVLLNIAMLSPMIVKWLRHRQETPTGSPDSPVPPVQAEGATGGETSSR